MIRFPVSRLLEEPKLDLFAFLPTDAQPWALGFDVTIYVVRSTEEVLYVGKSDDDCFTRLRTHLGHSFRGQPGARSVLGQWIEEHLPRSKNWQIELYTTEETKGVVAKEFWSGFLKWRTENAEAAMIQTLRPRLNSLLTSTYSKSAKIAAPFRPADNRFSGQQAHSLQTFGSELTTKQVFVKWLEVTKSRGDAASSIAKNHAIGDYWFRFSPAVSDLPPRFITEDHIASFINRPDTAAGVSTRERHLSSIRMFLRYCEDTGLTARNVASRVRVDLRSLNQIKRDPRKVVPFTAAEVQQILSNSKGWWRWATAISNATALSLGEICQLKHEQLTKPGCLIVWTENRARCVGLPIDDHVTPELAVVLAEIPPSDSPFMFPPQAAQYSDIGSGRPKFSVQFMRLLDSLSIEGRSFNSLRQTAIARWKSIGFDPSALVTCSDPSSVGISRKQ